MGRFQYGILEMMPRIVTDIFNGLFGFHEEKAWSSVVAVPSDSPYNPKVKRKYALTCLHKFIKWITFVL